MAALALALTTSLAGSALLPTTAHADQGYASFPAAPAAEPQRTWYGGEIMLSDLASIGVLVAAGNVGDSGAAEALALGGSLGLASAPAFTHGAHGNGGAAAGSIALRLGLPAAGMYIGAATCDEEAHRDEFLGCLGAAAGGFMLGGIAAMVIDDFGLAWSDAPTSTRAPGYQLGLAPRSGGMTLSLGGAF